ncbi:MAG: hypothetical protein F6J93_39160 [Oscillatoria sp. SIO1A7]|nr:hypothetical protein [Oscillatoria sp. SIO1A7]
MRSAIYYAFLSAGILHLAVFLSSDARFEIAVVWDLGCRRSLFSIVNDRRIIDWKTSTPLAWTAGPSEMKGGQIANWVVGRRP